MRNNKKSPTTVNDRNRTGSLNAPEMALELIEGVQIFSPEPDLDQSEAQNTRARAIREGAPLGSLPTMPQGHDASEAMLMNKIGARLAFERSGVRLYEMLMQKRAAMSAKDAPTLEDLRHIRDEELEHFHMLQRCVVELEGDPTVVTPAADIEGVVSSGLFQVIADPRTTVAQCLDAILTAELVDNDCWTVLADLARTRGRNELADKFDEALAEEQEHLKNVRSWIRREVIPDVE
jgi:rubrerythrin